MLSYAIRKLLLTIPVLFGLSFLIFLLTYAQEDSALAVLSGSKNLSVAQTVYYTELFHLDDSLFSQYWHFLERIFTSFVSSSEVDSSSLIFFDRLPATAEIILSALFISLALGIPVGCLAAFFHGSTTDKSIRSASIIFYSMPVFWISYLLIYLVSIKLQWTPVAGRINLIFDIEETTGFILLDCLLSEQPYKWQAFYDAILHAILPVLSLSIIPTALITRFVRNGMIEVINSDYYRTANSTGIPFFRILFIHCLRNALIPLLGMFGLLVNILVTSAIVVESIFVWPGVGAWLVDSVNQQDFTTTQSLGVLIAFIVVLFNLLFQILYGWANPRVRIA
jgi:ABC-type dipeptide/oligopeptide/nickel transport system permease component